MMEFEVSIDASGCLKALSEMERAILDAARSSLREAATVALQSIQATTRFQDRTGALRRNIRTTQKDDWLIRIRPSKRYARWVNFGTRAHLITPKTPGGSLRFFVGGLARFASKVHHPGTQPRPFMQDAEIAAQHSINTNFQRRLNDIVGGE